MSLIGHPVEIYPRPHYAVEDTEGYMMINKGVPYRGHIVGYDALNKEYCIEYVDGLAVKQFYVLDPATDSQCKLLTTGG